VHFATLLEYGYEQVDRGRCSGHATPMSEQVDRGRCSGHATPMSCRIVFAVLPLSIGVWLVIRGPYPQLMAVVFRG